MTALKITAGDITFDAVLEEEKAPLTCAAFRKVMPFSGQIVHVRWSGEGVWIPLGDTDFGVGYENHTSFPPRGRSSSIPAGSARRRSSWPMAGYPSPRRWGSWPATISSR
jgi:hypothetical protein